MAYPNLIGHIALARLLMELRQDDMVIHHVCCIPIQFHKKDLNIDKSFGHIRYDVHIRDRLLDLMSQVIVCCCE